MKISLCNRNKTWDYIWALSSPSPQNILGGTQITQNIRATALKCDTDQKLWQEVASFQDMVLLQDAESEVERK